MEVAGEMQIDVFHRHHLRIASARRAAFDSEHRSQTGSRRQMIACLPIWLSASPSPTVVVVLPSPAAVGVMAVTRMSLPSGLSFRRVDVVETDFGFVVTVIFDAGGRNSQARGNLADGLAGLHSERSRCRNSRLTPKSLSAAKPRADGTASRYRRPC